MVEDYDPGNSEDPHVCETPCDLTHRKVELRQEVYGGGAPGLECIRPFVIRAARGRYTDVILEHPARTRAKDCP